MKFSILASILALTGTAYAQTQVQTTANRAATASPTNSVGCFFMNGEWTCAAPRTNSIVAAGGSPTASSTYAVASPTESTGCTWHISHWDCTGNRDGSAVEASSGGDCVIHVGHTHGDCSGIDTSCGVTSLGTYNHGLHIGAIFIVLVTSALGVMIPLISGRRKSDTSHATAARISESKTLFKPTSFWSSLFFVAKHFGTGIIISTAFIHLLFHGFVMFNNECIGHLAFEATAPAIALAAFFVTFLLDFFGARYFAHQKGTETPGSLEKSSTPESPDLQAVNMAALEAHGHSHGFIGASGKDQHWQVMILEAGIIFHSIMIGVTLGAGGGEGWSTLLIVIIFHQFFEGLALGARIALLDFDSRWTAWIMGLAFTLITPIGIAIGVGVHENFSANGKAPLLAVGILNSISAGILLYTAAELLSNDFTAGALLRAKMSRVVIALAALVAGMICMSVLGKWA